MKFGNCMSGLVTGMIICGSAHARSINTDTFSPYTSPSTPQDSASLAGISGLSNLSFAPGISITTAGDFVYGIQSNYTPASVNYPSYTSSTAYMYNWGSMPTNQGAGISEQVMLYEPASSAGEPFSLEVDFNYNSNVVTNGCAGQKATFAAGNTTFTDTFSATNSCTAGTNAFFFNSSGQLIGGTPAGWQTATTAAPEIDSKSAIGALTLLLGFVAVMRDRRQSGGKLVRAGNAPR